MRIFPLALALATAVAVSSMVALAQTSQSLGEQAFQRAQWAFENCGHTRCKLKTQTPIDQVQESSRTGEVTADTDAAGFASWLIYEVSPVHLFEVESLAPGHEIPQAKTFAHYFASLDEKAKSGWLKIERVDQLRRGDFICWDEEKTNAKHDCAHIMMVAAPPSSVQTMAVDGKLVPYIAIKVIDSSSVEHFTEQLPPLAGQKHRDGLGEGYIRLAINDDCAAVGYWLGASADAAAADGAPAKRAPIIACARMTGKTRRPHVSLSDVENIRPNERKTGGFAF